MSKTTSGTSKKKVDDSTYEHEQQFILRMPPEAAENLRTEVVNGSPTLHHNISIEMMPDMRCALIRYGHFIYNAKLVDLPCIVESLKTVDRKSFYKTADICQMLVCTEEDDQEDVENLTKKQREKKYTWNHGITQPLKNVRRRRFRKTLTKKYNEQPDIEKEVRQLFRMDSEAIDVKWEVIAEESTQGASPTHDTSKTTEETTGARGVIGGGLADIDIFGELSSSEEDEKDVNVDSPGDDDGNASSKQGAGQSTGSGVEKVKSDKVDSKVGKNQKDVLGKSESDSQDQEMLLLRLDSLKTDIDNLRSQRMEHETTMATIDNPVLKDHFQEMLDKLAIEENDKELQYQMLISMRDNS